MNSAPRQFATTRWSMVVAAANSDPETARPALTDLCQSYWPPLFEYARRKGFQHQDAADLTQGFFARLLEKNFLRDAEENRGRFRTFLLTAFQRFLMNEYDRATALKRGGGQSIISMDSASDESSLQLHPIDDVTPEHLFERRWAITLLSRVLMLLEKEMSERGRGPVFAACRDFLLNDSTDSYASVAKQLEMTETAIKVAVHRMRQRYRELLLNEVRQTISDERDLDDEIQHLLTVLN